MRNICTRGTLYLQGSSSFYAKQRVHSIRHRDSTPVARRCTSSVVPRLTRCAPYQVQLYHNARLSSRRSHLESAITLRGWIGAFTGAVFVFAGYYYATDTRSSFQPYVVMPLMRLLYPDAETAHVVSISSLQALHAYNLHPRERLGTDAKNSSLHTSVFGVPLSNPIALSGGFDKNAEAISALFALGPAIVEIGGVTPLPQPGNEKPRVWRVASRDGLVNRYGLNSEGAEHVARQLSTRVRAYAESAGLGFDDSSEQLVLDGATGVPPGSLIPGKLLAVQIAKNKDTPDGNNAAVRQDYVTCVEKLGKYADIVVVNVSSPNTPGLRTLQRLEPLRNILSGVVTAAKKVPRKSKPAVMVKVSPDEDSDEDIFGICLAVWQSGVDGVIVGNTTRSRPVHGRVPLEEAQALEQQGGYSGPEIFEKTLDLVKKYRSIIDEPLDVYEEENLTPKVIFASGGICNAADAAKVLEAGASTAMIYTALTYQGPGIFTKMKIQLAKILESQKQP